MQRPFDLQPTGRMLRQFAALWSVVFLVLTARGIGQGYGRPAVTLAAAAVALGAAGIVAPRIIRPVFFSAMTVTYPIGWVISHVILGLLFYGLFTPIGVFFRLRGRDVLRLNPQRRSLTYWQVKPSPTSKSQYLSQF